MTNALVSTKPYVVKLAPATGYRMREVLRVPETKLAERPASLQGNDKAPSFFWNTPYAALAVAVNRLGSSGISKVVRSVGQDNLRIGTGIGMAAVAGYMATRKTIAPKNKMKLQMFALGAGLDALEAIWDSSRR